MQSLHDHSVVFKDMFDGRKACCMVFRDFPLYFTHFNGTVLMDHVNNEARFIIMCGENTGALPPSCGSLAVLQNRGHAVTRTHAVLG